MPIQASTTSHLNVRSSDGRHLNLIVPVAMSMTDVRQRIAMGMGVPLASGHAMNMKLNGADNGLTIDQMTDVSDVVRAASSYRVNIVIDNLHTLCPRATFDVVKILQHWSSPALSSKLAYRKATTTLKDLATRVLSAPSSRHALNPTAANRIFGRVARGIELLKKVGIVVTPTAVYGRADMDGRPLQVVDDHLTMMAAAADQATVVSGLAMTPRTTRSDVPRLSLPSIAIRHRRQRAFRNLTYEALVQLENVSVGLDQDTLHMMPLQTLRQSDLTIMLNVGHAVCGICLEQFAVGDTLMRLPCLHAFHRHCSTTWLDGSKKCPIDRMEVSGVKTSYPMGRPA